MSNWREMRERDLIESEAHPMKASPGKMAQLQLEVLLDIRELLENLDDARRIGEAVATAMAPLPRNMQRFQSFDVGDFPDGYFEQNNGESHGPA